MILACHDKIQLGSRLTLSRANEVVILYLDWFPALDRSKKYSECNVMKTEKIMQRAVASVGILK